MYYLMFKNFGEDKTGEGLKLKEKCLKILGITSLVMIVIMFSHSLWGCTLVDCANICNY